MSAALFLPSSYLHLPDRCYSLESETWSKLPANGLLPLCWNAELAHKLDLEQPTEQLYRQLAGATREGLPPALALAYAGHQFGYFVPSLGDGRAVMLGEISDTSSKRKRWDIQLKGSGRTQFSRGGDGCLPFHSALKEFTYSQAMYALGIPTAQSLAVLPLGFTVFRSAPPPAREQQAVVLSRVAECHLRVGSLEYFAAQKDWKTVQALADYLIQRSYPELQVPENCIDNTSQNIYWELALAISRRLGRLCALWQSFGFVHGVLNTDNTSLCGETIDYGPCAFLSQYRSNAVFSSIDLNGRYAFGNQPEILKWNLRSLLYCLRPLLGQETAANESWIQPVVDEFSIYFREAWQRQMLLRLGFPDKQASEQRGALVADFLALLEKSDCDYHACFWALQRELSASTHSPGNWKIFDRVGEVTCGEEWRSWKTRWFGELSAAYGVAIGPNSGHPAEVQMQAQNPLFVPRNQWLEQAIREAEQGDWRLYNRLLELARSPWLGSGFGDVPKISQFCLPPAGISTDCTTYCGT